MSVLVTDSWANCGLAVVRSLGRAGVKIACSDAGEFSAALHSKYCGRRFPTPSPDSEPVGFTDAVAEELSKVTYDVLMPLTDRSLILLSEARRKLGPVKLPLPDHETVLAAQDKSRMLRLAQGLGIGTPKTFFPMDRREATEIAKDLTYPVVVKCRVSRVWRGGRIRFGTTEYAEDAQSLPRIYGRLEEAVDRPMIQEYVPGRGLGVFALMNKGKPRAVFMHERIREYPPSGGISVLAKSVRDDDLMEQGLRLLRELKWHGVAMVEFKVADDGKAKLMEVNGRFWGSLQLAVDAGVDFPLLLFRMAKDGDVEEVREYKVGVKHRWLIPHDVLALLAVLAANKVPGVRYPSWVQAVLDFMNFFGADVRYDIYLDDPLPEILNAVRLPLTVLQAARNWMSKRRNTGA